MLCGVLLGTLNGYGQRRPDDHKTGYIGIKAGVNYAQVLDEDEVFNIDEALVPVVNAGLVFHQELSDYLGFQGEIVFSQKGDVYSYPTGGTLGNTNTSVKVKALEVPLMLTVKPTGASPVQPYLNLGVGVAYLLGDVDIKTDLDVSNPDQFKELVNKEFSTQIEPTAQLGAGIRFLSSSKSYIDLDFRYARGFVDIFEGTSPTETFSVAFLFSVVKFSRRGLRSR